MTGMNILGSTGISDYQSRTVTISVAGVCQQSVLKMGNYKVRIPFSQMSQALQTINHQGGKVVSVQVMSNSSVVTGAADHPKHDAEGAAASQEGSSNKKAARRKRQ